MIHCAQKLVCDGTTQLRCAGIPVGENEVAALNKP